MPDEILQHYQHAEKQGGDLLISYLEIQIIPYEGQHVPKELIAAEVESTLKVSESVGVAVSVKTDVKPERKITSQPLGQLKSANIGIKETLNPKKSQGLLDDTALPEINEPYTEEQLKKHWRDYAYQLKNSNRDSLFTTLTMSEMMIGSDHLITLKIRNHQVNEFESEKIQLLRYLRFQLNNTSINLIHQVEKTETLSVLDSKASFEKLAETNGSLNKLRKLFNLDIEY